ncbi:hypothetical protein ABZS66_59425 [Dactylosporangium sp. NPDC005572]|uniref:hypothetical protein n=1 Tax=Dactylosporangium sp. NPDC005572 TaxID=3156889 RepID=UPI0033ACE48A
MRLRTAEPGTSGARDRCSIRTDADSSTTGAGEVGVLGDGTIVVADPPSSVTLSADGGRTWTRFG